MVGNLFKKTNPKCEGCPILQKNLPRHAILEDEFEDECDILFVSDAPKMFEGEWSAFRPQEWSLIMKELSQLDLPDYIHIGFTYASKCPNMSMDKMPAKARKMCFEHLADSIDHYKPKLVFSCSKLGTNIFYKKAKEAGKIRGKLVDMQMDEGRHKFKIVSTIHPYQVIAEPKNAYLFHTDIKNNVNEVILGITDKKTVDYTVIWDEYGATHHIDLTRTNNPVAVDIETTGLNFLEDYIHTIAFTEVNQETGEPIKTVAMPIHHKDFKEEHNRKTVIQFAREVLANPNNRKIFQNAIFDLRFLAKIDIKDIPNVWDTKLLQHFVNEEVPKSLSDLVYYYFNEEI